MKRFQVFAMPLAAVLLTVFSGCTPPVDAIGLSNDQLLIDRNTQPVSIQVWNTSADVPVATVEVNASKSWIQPSVGVISSIAPSGATLDKKTVKITIDRRTLKAGTYNETITFGGRNLVSKTLDLRVIQDVDGSQGGNLNIIDRGQTYESPYLISFNFRLEDKDGNAVIAQPAQFGVSAQEGDTPVSEVTNVFLRNAAARQLKAAVVFDYSLGMHQIDGAIHNMEDAAKTYFLPALNSSALVSLFEFHVEVTGVPPAQVTGFTADHDFLVNKINHLEADYVAGFTGGSRAWDALLLASQAFGDDSGPNEDRYVLLFSDGNDTSSRNATVNDVIAAATSRRVRVYTIAFGATPNEADLEAIATATGGKYIPAASVDQLRTNFQKIITDLDGQYVLRWATPKRANVQFLPSFTISYPKTPPNDSDTLIASNVFSVSAHAGDDLKGLLNVVPSDDEVNSIAFLRANYVPRNIKRLRVFFQSSIPFNTSIVSPGDDGLLGGWIKTETAANGGKWIDLTPPNANTELPFATFGPLLRFDFQGVVPDLAKPFDAIYVDDTVYANNQTFGVDGYDNVPPAP